MGKFLAAIGSETFKVLAPYLLLGFAIWMLTAGGCNRLGKIRNNWRTNRAIAKAVRAEADRCRKECDCGGRDGGRRRWFSRAEFNEPEPKWFSLLEFGAGGVDSVDIPSDPIDARIDPIADPIEFHVEPTPAEPTTPIGYITIDSPIDDHLADAGKKVHVITVHYRDPCSYCDKWKEVEESRFIAAAKKKGVDLEIRYEKVEDENTFVPWFEINWNGTKARVNGYMTIKQMNAAILKARNGN